MRIAMMLVLALLAIVAGGVGTGLWREAQVARKASAALLADAGRAPAVPQADADLPPPVARYLQRALGDAPRRIRVARLSQSGELRTGIKARSWTAFSAEQLVVPAAPGFVWNARVAMPLGAHVRVLDSYVGGVGAGRVSVMSAMASTADAAAPELNSGALHRYLAEAVWVPSALLPLAGVRWTPISDRAALAALEDRGTTVELEFRFDEAGDVAAVHSPGRWGRFDGTYRQVAWEGRFRDYRVVDGVRVPGYGEVGWYEGRTWQPVWRGRLDQIRFEFAP